MSGVQSSASDVDVDLGRLFSGIALRWKRIVFIALAVTALALAFVFAVGISNVPQGLGGTAGMLAAGWERSRVTRLWVAVCVLSIIAAALGWG